MHRTFRLVGHGLNVAAEFHLTADECRGIAAALGSHDGGSIEMLAAAEAIEDEIGAGR